MSRRMNLERQGRQRGIAMVIVLMMLFVITGLALFSARYASMSEGIARNQLDSERARQAAESALRDAERDLRLAGNVAGAPCPRDTARPVVAGISAFGATCPGGQCTTPETVFVQSNWSTGASGEPWWPATGTYVSRWNDNVASKPRGASASCTFTGGVPIGTYTNAPTIPGVARQPEYLIELVSRQSGRLTFYRITARGFGAFEQNQVVLQSYVQPFVVL